MSDKKIEIEVPEGYELVQDGMNIKFVKKGLQSIFQLFLLRLQ
jgi:hypothetical protein